MTKAKGLKVLECLEGAEFDVECIHKDETPA
jgi:hypothetical protein